MTQNNDSEVDVPENLTPSKSGGEWDNGVPRGDTGEKDLDSLEDGAWREDPDDYNRDAATDFDEEQEVGDPEAPPADDVEPPADDAEQVEDEDIEVSEEAEQVSTRANDRIRQLVEEKNAEREQRRALESKVEALLTLQQRQLEFQERQQAEQFSRSRAEANTEKQRQFVEQLKQYGYNDGDVAHVLSLQALEAARAAQERMEQLSTERETQAREAGYRAYENALKSELEKSLTDPRTGKSLVNDAAKVSIYRAAYALARDEQIADPSEAVKQVVAPLLAEIRAPSKATKRPSPKDPVHKSISAQGRAAGKSPGTRASGKAPMARDVKAFLK